MQTADFSQIELAEEKSLQRVDHVRRLIEEQKRVAGISHRLSISTPELCKGDETLVTGAYLFDWDLTSDEWVDVANQALGINLHTPGIEVLFVIPDSPADVAGLRAGDRVIRLGEWRVPSGSGAFTELHQRFHALRIAQATTVNLRVQRGGRFIDVAVYPLVGCNYPVVLREDESMGAYSDGRMIMINRGMLRFARSDDDLATVLTHEMAHNVLDHVDAKRKNAVQGAMVGVVVDVLLAAATGIKTNTFEQIGTNVGALAYSKDFEEEADYYGAYLMARAGYDVASIPAFWRYLGSVDQRQMSYNLTHPTSVERSVHMRKTVDEIDRKRLEDKPLLPGK